MIIITDLLNKLYCRHTVVCILVPVSSEPYLDHPRLPADPEAAELIPGQDARRGSADQRIPHFTHRDPGAAVLPAPQHNLQHFHAVVGACRKGKVGIVVGLHCHLELGHAGWLLHILVLILVGSRDVDPL